MPELPDVDGFRRYLASHAQGQRIRRVEVLDVGVLRNTSPKHFADALRGRRFAEAVRHGKWLLAHTDGPTQAIHFGMTASWPVRKLAKAGIATTGWCSSWTAGELRYRDLRKLRGAWLLATREDEARLVASQGQYALEISAKEFAERLTRRNRALKPALMDQKVVAGLGNLLVDETLWRARIVPERGTQSLSPAELRKRHAAMHRVLLASLPEGCVPPKPRWLTKHRAIDQRCPHCNATLRRARIGGRSSYWCAKCQR